MPEQTQRDCKVSNGDTHETCEGQIGFRAFRLEP